MMAETGLGVATIVVVPLGISRIDAGRRFASQLITDDETQKQLVRRGIHPDLIEVSPAKGKERIGIEQVRDVIHQSQFAPVAGRRKVCLIPQGEALTPEAENALLKVLEEPSPYIAFVILVGSSGDLLPTIRSRSQLIHMPPGASAIAQLKAVGYSEADAAYLLDMVGEPEIAPFLAEHVDLSAQVGEAQRRVKDATVEDLCSLVTTGGITAHTAGVALVSRLLDGDPRMLVAAAHALAGQGRDQVLSFLRVLLRIAFTGVRVAAGLSVDPDPALIEIVRRLGPARLTTIAQAAEEARRAVEGYTPAEPVLVWLFLTVSGGGNDG